MYRRCATSAIKSGVSVEFSCESSDKLCVLRRIDGHSLWWTVKYIRFFFHLTQEAYFNRANTSSLRKLGFADQ